MLYYKEQLTEEAVLAETVFTTSEFQPYNTGHAAASPFAALVRRCKGLKPLNHDKSRLS